MKPFSKFPVVIKLFFVSKVVIGLHNDVKFLSLKRQFKLSIKKGKKSLFDMVFNSIN